MTDESVSPRRWAEHVCGATTDALREFEDRMEDETVPEGPVRSVADLSERAANLDTFIGGVHSVLAAMQDGMQSAGRPRIRGGDDRTVRILVADLDRMLDGLADVREEIGRFIDASAHERQLASRRLVIALQRNLSEDAFRPLVEHWPVPLLRAMTSAPACGEIGAMLDDTLGVR